MKFILAILTLLVSYSSFSSDCSFTYKAIDITIDRNYDSVTGNYDWENEMNVIAKNSRGEIIENTATLAWVHNGNNYASSWAKTRRSKLFTDLGHELELEIIEGKVHINLIVEDIDLIKNDEIVNVDFSFDIEDLSWSNNKTINKNGLIFNFKILKECNYR